MNYLSMFFDLDSLKKLDDYNKALNIVKVIFENKVDKAGEPYYYHLYEVADNLDTFEEKTVGLLHDIVEDTEVTFEDLIEVGFSDEVIEALRLVTRIKGESYEEFIDRIINSNNLIAIKVKYYDMKNNMDPERLERIPDEYTRERLVNKYKPQFERLTQVMHARKLFDKPQVEIKK